MENSPRIIKRYANRKLYDSVESRYVTLEHVGLMVKEGIEVQIIDNRSKEDITGPTLARLVMNEERVKNSSLPISTLRQLVQSGGELITKRVTQPVSNLRGEAEKTVSNLRGEAEKTVSNLKGEARKNVANFREDVEKSLNKLLTKEREGAEAIRQGARDWLEGAQARLDEAHRHMDEKIAEVRAAIPIVLSNRADLDQLHGRVDALEKILKEKGIDLDT